MSAKKITSVLSQIETSLRLQEYRPPEGKEKPADGKPIEQSSDKDSDEVRKKVCNEVANGISAALSRLERKFESAQEANDYVLEIMVDLRGKYHAELMNVLRRFDRVGAEKFQQMYRRDLA